MLQNGESNINKKNEAINLFRNLWCGLHFSFFSASQFLNSQVAAVAKNVLNLAEILHLFSWDAEFAIVFDTLRLIYCYNLWDCF